MTKQPSRSPSKKDGMTLAIDVGGTHIKVMHSPRSKERRFKSGRSMTAQRAVSNILKLTSDWSYDRVSIGYPGPVVHNRPIAEPHNLGIGWVGFDFAQAFGRPVRIVNDAVMQALGDYEGGRMLFLGLGTGLGSAMIVEGIIEPMELAHLGFKHGKSFEDYLGARGLKHRGVEKWRASVAEAIDHLQKALEPEYTVIGGGNASKLKSLPPNVRIGSNDRAFAGGFELWERKRVRNA